MWIQGLLVVLGDDTNGVGGCPLERVECEETDEETSLSSLSARDERRRQMERISQFQGLLCFPYLYCFLTYYTGRDSQR